MKKPLIRVLCLLLPLLLLLPATAGARESDTSTATARDITPEARISVAFSNGTTRSLRDRNLLTAMQSGKQKNPCVVITLPDTPCEAVYVAFGNNVLPFTVQSRQGKAWVDVARWEEPYAQAYIMFAPQTDFRLCFDTGGKYVELFIRELYLFSAGTADESIVHVWSPPLEKADLLVIVAHPDDEVLWLGGTLPTYAGERGLNTVVATLTCHTSSRRQELLNSIWHCGVRAYPDIGGFKDVKESSVTEQYKQWGRDKVDAHIVRLLRRYKPEVVVTHAYDGEYGHVAHRVCANAVHRAAALAADAQYDASSAAQYGVWQVSKVYMHKGEENVTVMDWRVPLRAFGGRTAFDVACEAYAMHVSAPQPSASNPQPVFYVAPEDDENSCFIFTLDYSAVGEDEAGGDFFEHIDPARLCGAGQGGD